MSRDEAIAALIALLQSQSDLDYDDAEQQILEVTDDETDEQVIQRLQQ